MGNSGTERRRSKRRRGSSGIDSDSEANSSEKRSDKERHDSRMNYDRCYKQTVSYRQTKGTNEYTPERDRSGDGGSYRSRADPRTDHRYYTLENMSRHRSNGEEASNWMNEQYGDSLNRKSSVSYSQSKGAHEYTPERDRSGDGGSYRSRADPRTDHRYYTSENMSRHRSNGEEASNWMNEQYTDSLNRKSNVIYSQSKGAHEYTPERDRSGDGRSYRSRADARNYHSYYYPEPMSRHRSNGEVASNRGGYKRNSEDHLHSGKLHPRSKSSTRTPFVKQENDASGQAKRSKQSDREEGSPGSFTVSEVERSIMIEGRVLKKKLKGLKRDESKLKRMYDLDAQSIGKINYKGRQWYPQVETGPVLLEDRYVAKRHYHDNPNLDYEQ